MTQQCGNCKWWDRNSSEDGFEERVSVCNAPIPSSMVGSKELMLESDGQYCQVYEERKE